MKIILAGGTGLLGQILARELGGQGHQVVVLSRRTGADSRPIAWDGRTLGAWAREVDEADAVVNLAAPNPVTQHAFMATLRSTWGARVGLPASRWMVELGAFLLGTDTELVLKSRRVIPGRLSDAGFTFDFPE